jgi:hypothetical protein
MNTLRKKIESKGYSLDEFLIEIGFSLRWYRTHSKIGASRHDFLIRKIDQLEPIK